MSDAPPTIKILVMDTSPLITLAAAKSLSILLYPGLPVIIPDAVYYEATFDISKLGAQDIIDWAHENADKIQVVSTHTYADEQALQRIQPNRRPHNVGEMAAFEVVRDTPTIGTGERGLLIFEDEKVIRRAVIETDPDRVILITTTDFLRALEDSRIIQSADHVLDDAVASGRTIKRHELFQDHPPEIREAVRETILAAHRDPNALLNRRETPQQQEKRFDTIMEAASRENAKGKSQEPEREK